MTIRSIASVREYSVLGFKKEAGASAASVDTELAYRDYNMLVKTASQLGTRAQAQSALRAMEKDEYLAEW